MKNEAAPASSVMAMISRLPAISRTLEMTSPKPRTARGGAARRCGTRAGRSGAFHSHSTSGR